MRRRIHATLHCKPKCKIALSSHIFLMQTSLSFFDFDFDFDLAAAQERLWG